MPALSVSVALVTTLVVVAPASLKEGPAEQPTDWTKVEKNVGIGASLGDVSGISIKWFLRRQHALQFQLGWAPLHEGDWIFDVAYLWHTKPVGDSPIVDVMPYLGLGVGVGFWAQPPPGQLSYTGRGKSDAGVGLLLRTPLGLAFHWVDHPIDTAIEIAWAPYLVRSGPEVELRYGDASIKVRYYF